MLRTFLHAALTDEGQCLWPMRLIIVVLCYNNMCVRAYVYPLFGAKIGTVVHMTVM
jgi:hypothetical protein